VAALPALSDAIRQALVTLVENALPEAEAKAISDRTKAALAAYKACGGFLGGQLPQCRGLS